MKLPVETIARKVLASSVSISPPSIIPALKWEIISFVCRSQSRDTRPPYGQKASALGGPFSSRSAALAGEDKMRLQAFSIKAICVAAAFVGFGNISAAQAQDSNVAYRAELLPLNTNITGSSGAGEVTYAISGDQLTISVTAEGVPSSIEHWQ